MNRSEDSTRGDHPHAEAAPVPAITLLDLLIPIARHGRTLVVVSGAVAVLAFASSFLLADRYVSRTTFLPPAQQQSSAAAAVAQLGALSGLAGAAANLKNPVDQYVALLQSVSVSNRMIDTFGLMQVYDEKYRYKARETLAENVRFVIGKKDGLITVEVEDESAERAAQMANRYVAELRTLTHQLALTEAQQRRVFFEGQFAETRKRLEQAQVALQATGFNSGALRLDVRASSEAYARLRAEVTAAEVRLQTLRSKLADSAAEVQQALSTLVALRSQLGRLEATSGAAESPDYVTKFREFKYQETLFDMFARQFELARVDESREGALIQVVDEARPAERKSYPRRAWIALAAGGAALVAGIAFVLLRHALRIGARDPATAEHLRQLRDALRRQTTP